MKSGVQMNFLERRLRADRALSQLTRMAHDTTETLSSCEHRGLYQLESTWVERSSTALPAVHVLIGSALVARWRAFSIVVVAFVRGLWARACDDAHRAFARVRVAWSCDLPRIFMALREGYAGGVTWLRKLRGRKHAEHETRTRDRAHHRMM